jgi:hypothetical protein
VSYCKYDAVSTCSVCGHVAPVPGLIRECGRGSFVRGEPPRQVSSGRPLKHSPPKVAGGPGNELKKLLARVGIKASQGCSCNTRARLMDARGPAWCEANVEEIVGWLREEATKRGLPFVDMAGRMLVRRAIANARKAEARRAKEAQAAAAEGRSA